MYNLKHREIMKTKRYISTMLVVLIFATASIQAQTAKRSRSTEKQERPKATSTQVRRAPSEKAKSAQTQGKVQTRQAPQRKAAPARKVQTRQAPQRKAAPARKVQTQQAYQRQAAAPGRKLSKPEPRQGSVNSAHLGEPAPRKATRNSYATPRFSAPKHTAKYHNRHYYGGHHYHYAYPTTKVKFHHHHDTYLHRYNVLYYPSYTHIYWTRSMYRDYRKWYPDYRWTYNYGYRIQTISVFDAKYNLGEVAMVYGRVYATWHNKQTDDYLLFFGGDYPYQQFTVVLPGRVARRYSWRPERYFLGEHITATGLITTFDGIPEIVVKHKRQIGIY
jgi:hypothetical protein